MDYTIYRMEYYNLHVIKTNKFKTISTKVIFKTELKKENMAIRNVLVNVLLDSSKKYKTRRELEIKSEELYGVSLECSNIGSGKYGLTTFSEIFLNEKYTEKGLNKDSFNFLFDIILDPNVKDGLFNKDSFNVAKRIAKEEILSEKDNPTRYANKRLLQIMNEDSPSAFPTKGELKDLRKITNRKLYKYYLDLINNSIVDIVVIGDVDPSEIKEIFDNKMKYKKNKINSDSHYIIDKLLKNTPAYIKEKLPVNQSQLCMGFKFDDLSDFELKYVLNVYSFILGGSGDSKLFQNVREKNSLCYHISSSYAVLNGILKVGAGIDKKEADRVIELVKEEIKNMEKGDFSNDDLNKAKKIYISSCLEMLDSPNSIMNLYISKEYLNSDLIEDKIKKIEKVTIDDVKKLASKIHLDTIFLLEGDDK